MVKGFDRKLLKVIEIVAESHGVSGGRKSTSPATVMCFVSELLLVLLQICLQSFEKKHHFI